MVQVGVLVHKLPLMLAMYWHPDPHQRIHLVENILVWITVVNIRIKVGKTFSNVIF